MQMRRDKELNVLKCLVRGRLTVLLLKEIYQ